MQLPSISNQSPNSSSQTNVHPPSQLGGDAGVVVVEVVTGGVGKVVVGGGVGMVTVVIVFDVDVQPSASQG